MNYNYLDPYYYPSIDEMIKGFRYQFLVQTRYREEYPNTNCKSVEYIFSNYEVGGYLDIDPKNYEFYINKGYIRAIKKEAKVYIEAKETYKGRCLNKGEIKITDYWQYLIYIYEEFLVSFIDVVDIVLEETLFNNKAYYYELQSFDSNTGSVLLQSSSPRFIIVSGEGFWKNEPNSYNKVTSLFTKKHGYDIIKDQYGVDGKYRDIVSINNKLFKIVSAGEPVNLDLKNPYQVCLDKDDIIIISKTKEFTKRLQNELYKPYKDRIIKIRDSRIVLKSKLKKSVKTNFKISSYSMSERIAQFKKYNYAA